ncbi:MAG: phosphotransferase [Verrucomicrobia bacterium]|nr:phosphotransferase [Verrucomicrobiota bacterium]
MEAAIDIEDADQLVGYLRNTGRIDSQEELIVRKLSGGVSNKTVWLKRSNGQAWVIKQSLPKLRVRSDWFSDPARINIEANGLRFLPRVAPRGSITPLVFQDPSQHLLAMEAVPEPHQNWKQRLLCAKIESELFSLFAELLGSIHRESFRLRHELWPIFAEKKFFQTLRLEPYYEYSAAIAPEAGAFLKELIAWTLSQSETLVHGDFSPKNILVHDGRLILLDHEVLHFGDPAFDIGFSLTHILSKALHVREQRPALIEAARSYWKRYLDEAREMPWVEHLDVRAAKHTLACVLARVCGRSPLEYLSNQERLTQRQIVIEMIKENLTTVDGVITGFADRISDEPVRSRQTLSNDQSNKP